MSTTRETFLDKCPVCRVGVIRKKLASSRFLGLIKSYHYACNSCDSILTLFGERQYEYRSIDPRYPVQARQLSGGVFTKRELREISSGKRRRPDTWGQ